MKLDLHQFTGQKEYPRWVKLKASRQVIEAKIAHNLLNREFTATQPNKKWVSDLTYIGTAEVWLYLAAILDLYSRRVVGWAMSDSLHATLGYRGIFLMASLIFPKNSLIFSLKQHLTFWFYLRPYKWNARNCSTTRISRFPQTVRSKAAGREGRAFFRAIYPIGFAVL